GATGQWRCRRVTGGARGVLPPPTTLRRAPRGHPTQPRKLCLTPRRSSPEDIGLGGGHTPPAPPPPPPTARIDRTTPRRWEVGLEVGSPGGRRVGPGASP